MALAFADNAAFHRATVLGMSRPLIEKALGEHFGRPVKLADAPLSAAPGLSLAEEEAQGRVERETSIDARVRAHPAVRTALRMLGGELEHVRVLEAEAEAPPSPPPPVSGGPDES